MRGIWPCFVSVFALYGCMLWLDLPFETGGPFIGPVLEERQHFKYSISFLVYCHRFWKYVAWYFNHNVACSLKHSEGSVEGNYSVCAHCRQRVQWKKQCGHNVTRRDEESFLYHVRHPRESKLSVTRCEVLKLCSSSLCERIRGCCMGTAYLAGLYAGTSQHKIPSASLSLHVQGLIYCVYVCARVCVFRVCTAFSLFIMLFVVGYLVCQL